MLITIMILGIISTGIFSLGCVIACKIKEDCMCSFVMGIIGIISLITTTISLFLLLILTSTGVHTVTEEKDKFYLTELEVQSNNKAIYVYESIGFQDNEYYNFAFNKNGELVKEYIQKNSEYIKPANEDIPYVIEYEKSTVCNNDTLAFLIGNNIPSPFTYYELYIDDSHVLKLNFKKG